MGLRVLVRLLMNKKWSIMMTNFKYVWMLAFACLTLASCSDSDEIGDSG